MLVAWELEKLKKNKDSRYHNRKIKEREKCKCTLNHTRTTDMIIIAL
jgi:hypothetical protein